MQVVAAEDLTPEGRQAALTLRRRAELALDPRLPPTTTSEFELQMRPHLAGGQFHQHWAVIDEDGVTRVLSHLESVGHEANRHFASIELFAAPDDDAAQRVAVSSVLQPLADDGRSTLQGWGPLTEPQHRFWNDLGARLAYVDQLSLLDVAAVDPALMQDWIDRRMERAADVELVAWTGLCPATHVDAYAVSRTAMNDAPQGDLDLNDEERTPEELLESDAQRLALGTEIHVLFAIDPEGEPVGHTAVHVNTHRPAASWQWDTVVLTAHRGRGIARWLKAAMWQYLRESEPEVTHLRTENAIDNDPMLSINQAMGFVPTNRFGGWQADLDTFRRALAG